MNTHPARERPAGGAWFRRLNWRKVGQLLLALFLFVLAIQLLKNGARVLVPFIREGLSVRNAWNALGFGWLFAYLRNVSLAFYIYRVKKKTEMLSFRDFLDHF